MSARIAIQKSNFTAGEIKPQLHAREDLVVYQNGAKAIENRVPMPEGGCVRRPGTRIVTALADQTQPGKLIPFKFSRSDARVLILSGGVAAVGYSGGGLIQSGGGNYTFAIPWSPSQYAGIRWFESADVIFACDGVNPPWQMARIADANWTIAPYAYANGPSLPQNTDVSKTIVASGVSGSVTLTANFAAFQAGHVGSIWRLDEGDLGSIPYWTADENIACTTSQTDPTTYRRNAGSVYAAFANAPATVSAGVNAPTQLQGSIQSGYGTCAFAFKYQDYGYVKITAVADSEHATATVIGIAETQQTVLPDSIATIPTYRWSEAAWSNVRGWPGLVTMCQQRLVWLREYEFWATNSGDDYRFEVTTADDSSIQGQLLSIDGSVLQPQWTYSSGWVVIGALDCEPVIRGPDMFDALTQTNVLAIVDKGQGSCPQIPAVVDAAVANIGVSRQRLYYTKIDRLIDTIGVAEISINSQHILAGLGAGTAYQHDPYRVIWGYSQNGDLWSYTFLPDQKVIAAARHPMPNGFVEDICAIPSADTTGVEIWMIVRRVINGQTFRFVEVMQPFFQSAAPSSPTAAGAWYVDCALPYSGSPTTTLSGLTHLAGATARVFGDGAWIGDFSVPPSGVIGLPRAVSTAVVGLPIKARLRTLPLDPTRPGSTTRGDMKQATHGAVDVLEAFGGSACGYAQDNDGNWQSTGFREDLFPSGSLVSGQPVPLQTARKSFSLDGVHGRRIELEMVDDHPYPSTVLALAPDIEDMEL